MLATCQVQACYLNKDQLLYLLLYSFFHLLIEHLLIISQRSSALKKILTFSILAMHTTAAHIYKEKSPEDALVNLQGNDQLAIEKMASFETGNRGTMVFAPNAAALAMAIENQASLIVLPEKIAIPDNIDLSQTGLLYSSNIGVSHARLKQKYGDHDYSQTGWSNIHPSAIIHESVRLPEEIRIGPNVVIEQNVTIGRACHLMANVVLQQGAKIGQNVCIHPGTIIGWACEIGDDCLLMSNTIIGGEGFGFAQDQSFNHHRIPHTGKVIIGDKVRIGSLTTIDRGTYGATTIGNGCIFDNHCHVAHNVSIGENCILISGFLCAGSSVLGNRVVASGGTMIKDHVSICDNTYLVHRAGVIKNITQPGIYAGAPTLPIKDYVQSNAIYRELGALRQQVLELTKRLEKK